MDTYAFLKVFRRLMLLLNLAICAYISVIFVLTPYRAARQADGLRFARELSALPSKPWMLSLAAVGLAILLFLSAVNRYRPQSIPSPNVVYWLEPILCMEVIFALHFSYNGLLLMVVVDLIDSLHGRNRAYFLGTMTSLYLVTSLEIFPSQLGLVPIVEYLMYYDTHVRQVMQSTIGVLSALNLILFVVYMVLLVGQRTEENSAIRRLNSELERANDQLSILNEQLKAYAAESERMAETRERNRLAREIQDTLGHALTGITAGADACIEMLEISPEMAKKQMQRIADTARQGMNEVRRSVRALRPDALERLQLPETLGRLCEEMQSTSRAAITLRINAENLRLSPDEEDAVYRIVQESITNAIRHGQATKVLVDISSAARQLTILIQDNGLGCKTVEPGFGLRHMRERLRLLNGSLKIDGTNGFRIEAKIPLRWGDEV